MAHFATTPAVGAVAFGLAVSITIAADASAHGFSGKDALFLLSLNGPAIIPLMYLGAEHMVTGYDHLLFLVGVVFFLYRLKDILLYVSLFTIGHSFTLLAGAAGHARKEESRSQRYQDRWSRGGCGSAAIPAPAAKE